MLSRRSSSFTYALPVAFVGLMAFASASVLPAAPLLTFDKSEAQISDDIAFAKGLAKEWGFVDLAGQVIRTIEKEGVSAATGERLGVVKCEIYAQGAVAERDRVRRNELFEQALGAYEDFLEDNPNSPSAPEARSGYITISTTFARSLEISMEEAIGAEAEALRARRMEVLSAANERTRTLIGELSSVEDESEIQKRERVNVMMMRASINIAIGKSSDEGVFNFEEARSILEDITVISGEASPQGLRAFDLMGQAYAAEQNWEMSSMFFEAVIEAALPSDPQYWAQIIKDNELSQSDKEQRWLFLEMSTAGLVDTLISNGDTKRATAYALHLYNTQRREGFSYSTQMGYPSLLASAKTLLDAGGVVAGKINQGQGAWYESADAAIEAGHTRSRDRLSTSDLALRIAQQVVKENPKNVLRMKGQHLIAEIIERGGEVDPAVLYEAAEGKYFAEKDQVALSSFKQVLAALEGKDKAMRVELGPKTFLRMGNTYKAMDLAFEAAMAYREGCTTWRGDPENDQHNANGYYKMMQELTQQSPGDAVLKQMFEESQNIAAELSTRDQDQILFDQAESMRRKREYPGAIAKYKQIKQSAIDYEKALVNIAVCTNRSGKADEAHLLFVDYIEKFVKDPKNAVTGSKVVKRTDAMATASFYRCFHLFNKEKYSEVISTSAKYYEDFPDQTNMAPWTMGMVGASYAKTEKIAEAKAMLLELMANYTDSVRISPLSNSIYAELTKSLEGTTDPAKRAELLTEMALLLETGNSTAPKPSMTNLRNESKHWIELENWEKAVAVLERIVEKFGDDPEQSKSMAAYIKPDLAQSYLELERVAEAYVILSEMMSSLDGKPSKRTGFNYARSVIGWVHGSASDIVEVPGAGQTEEAMKEAVDKLNSLSNSVKEKWTCEWYELKFMQAYGYYRWATAEGGPKDGTKMASAKRQLDNIVQQLGINFKGKDGVPGVDQMCVQDEDRASQLGEDVLRRRMVWLWGKVKNAK